MTINVSSWSIRNPSPAILLFVLLTVLGLMAFSALSVQNFPDIDVPRVSVSASLPGASPSQMETEVARKIENSLATVQGVKHLTTTLTDGTAEIGIEFRLESRPTRPSTTSATPSRGCAPTCRPICAIRSSRRWRSSARRS